MKNRIIFGIIFIVLGALIALGPQTIFPVCGIHASEQSAVQGSEQAGMPMSSQMADSASEENSTSSAMPMVMKCRTSAKAELPVGIAIAVLGVLIIVSRSVKGRIGLSIASALGGLFALLVPTVLIGVCASEQMRCRVLTLPALIILSILVIFVSVVNIVYLFKSGKKEQVQS